MRTPKLGTRQATKKNKIMHGSGYALAREAERHGVETAKEASDHAAAWGPTATTEKWRRQRIRGRRRGARHAGASHVEAERQRRERLNRLLLELRAAVPNVSKVDRASLLADAAAYIAQLTSRLRELEQGAARRARRETAAAKLTDASSSVLSGDRVAVRMVGAEEAMVRVESNKYSCVKHPVARLMKALSELEMEVRHAIASEVKDTTVQSVVVRLPSCEMAHGGEDELTRVIASRLQRQE